MSAEESDADRQDGRDETVNERMDRNWNEMLQEMRVTQTGTQILSGFLLTLVFQPTFADLDAFETGLYLVLVVAATFTTVLALAPVHLHRSLFRQHSKAALVSLGHLLLRTALLGLVVVITGTVLLIFDVATDNRMAGFTAAAAVLVVIALLAATPALARSPRVRAWAERKALASSARRDDRRD